MTDNNELTALHKEFRKPIRKLLIAEGEAVRGKDPIEQLQLFCIKVGIKWKGVSAEDLREDIIDYMLEQEDGEADIPNSDTESKPDPDKENVKEDEPKNEPEPGVIDESQIGDADKKNEAPIGGQAGLAPELADSAALAEQLQRAVHSGRINLTVEKADNSQALHAVQNAMATLHVALDALEQAKKCLES